MIYSKLVEAALSSPLQHRISACLMHHNKMIGSPMSNTARNYIRGSVSGSLHAETRAILTYYGNLINWDQKYGWRFQNRQHFKEGEKV
jgi:hypothetical protein